MLSSFEKEYYEYPGFWQPEELGDADRERIESAIRLLPVEVATILDVGCGNGIFCNRIKELTDRPVFAADRSLAALKYVKAAKVLADIGHLPFTAQSFDLVAAMEVLEHLPFKIFDLALQEISRVSRKYIMISVPNNEDLRVSMIACPKCMTIFNPAYHLRSFTKDKLKDLFANNGFRAENIYAVCKRPSSLFVTEVRLIARILGRYPKKIGTSLCPMCGYSERNIKAKTFANHELFSQLRQKINRLLKSLWPRKETFRWLIALYKKI